MLNKYNLLYTNDSVSRLRRLDKNVITFKNKAIVRKSQIFYFFLLK